MPDYIHFGHGDGPFLTTQVKTRINPFPEKRMLHISRPETFKTVYQARVHDRWRRVYGRMAGKATVYFVKIDGEAATIQFGRN